MHSHLIELKSGWSLWRDVCVRSAGFPAALAQTLREPQSVSAAQELVPHLREREPAVATRLKRHRLHSQRLALVAQLEADALATQGRLAHLLSTDAFERAVLWQNPTVAEHLKGLNAADGAGLLRGSRRRAVLATKYLYRYSLKNDTIGFFGPLAWGRFDEEQRVATLRAGGALIAGRKTYFEHWGIEALARVLSDDSRLRPWLCPRRSPLVRIEGGVLLHAFGEEAPLSPAEEAALRLCTGERSAMQIAEALAQQGLVAGESAAGLAVLEALDEREWISWRPEIPNVTLKPEAALRKQLEAVQQEPLRRELLRPLEHLDAARRAVDAAEAPAALASALRGVNEAFEASAGESATRREGALYAGRTLLFQECQRDIDLRLGDGLIAQLATPLAIILASARWLTHQVAQRYRTALEAAFEELSPSGAPVDFLPFHMSVSEHFPTLGAPGPDMPSLTDEVLAEFQSRWAQLLGPMEGREHSLSAEELWPRAQELFNAPSPGWPTARYHSPDLMLAAADAQALAGGDFRAVLGEVHLAVNTLEAAPVFFHHPQPERLRDALAADLGPGRVAPIIPKELMTRADAIPLCRDGVDFAFDDTPSWRPAAQVVGAAELVVERADGALRVRTRGHERSWDVLAFYDWPLSNQFCDAFKPLPPAPRRPRISLGNLVLAREQWRFARADLPFLSCEHAADRWVEAHRWARRHQLPSQSFVRTSREPKPFYFDLEAPLSLEMLCNMARDAEEISLTELLPASDQLWLHDAEGNRYTSELRMVAVDPQPFVAAHGERRAASR